MYIILMRHGEAVPQTEEVSNQNRSLTPKGMRQVRKSARMLAHFLKENPIRIYTSPYYRTRQTAGILAEECFAEEIHTADELLQSSWSPTTSSRTALRLRSSVIIRSCRHTFFPPAVRLSSSTWQGLPSSIMT